MPRTAVNLPDLLQPQGDGAPAADNNADDLLAQLAGDEVDRLLSEAEDAPPASGDFDLGDAASPGVRHNPDTADEAEASLDDLFNELDADDAEIAARAKAASLPAPVAVIAPAQSPSAEIPPAAKSAPPVTEVPAPTVVQPQANAVTPAVVPPQPVPESAADALAAEMEEDALAHDAALRRMKGGDQSPQTPTAKPAAIPAAPPASAPDPETVAGLELVSEAEATSGITIDLQAIADQAADAANNREPFLVRVLELVNAPLDGFSETMRAAIGKIALVTTLNAVGVFIYVLVFRRH
ncbi:MAG: hypothetical protein JWN40_2993 [Phycisphaerales bacterium]|nr:hypothetical protein [Phycisphaerales bacterium]